MRLLKSFLLPVLGAACLQQAAAQAPKPRTENVVLITLDGMRWQEVFGGADTTLFKQSKHYYSDRKSLQTLFGQSSTEQRRQALMPFLWSTVVKQGQVYGNRNLGSLVNVTNNQWFSYPGYNEILTGAADNARIHSNDPLPNPNVTVLEKLNQQPAFKGKVAAFGSWQVFPAIINEQRSGLPVNAGTDGADGPGLSAQEQLLDHMMAATPSPFGDERLDSFTGQYALEYVKRKKPRVLFVSFGDTDEFAHEGEYGAYLHSAHYTDMLIRQLWEYLQSDPQYKGKTTLLITTDHGRGAAAEGKWRDHGAKIPGADQIWLAALGPDTAPTGEANTGQLYQNQVAATLAQLLGAPFTPPSAGGASISPIVGKNNAVGKN
ncbi:sulfatase-like hydrolase/transferase [Hymenobacter sp. GOD-10R]|uniref:sulfatase-like hydrolase/transferase n=1 Tax=Hymenobacter sp. GOD-10R TaxID=3093922 RepID=UPI002D7A2891|nr:sulfatase-like hydrolase/transferase [Hymenobacter sp. GOD-10R]WRQ26181.1 sulfatase-like hydrolase/transferase [Hymenobacter sp. GOD-10R]